MIIIDLRTVHLTIDLTTDRRLELTAATKKPSGLDKGDHFHNIPYKPYCTTFLRWLLTPYRDFEIQSTERILCSDGGFTLPSAAWLNVTEQATSLDKDE